jgi:phosphoglucosamine mutase
LKKLFGTDGIRGIAGKDLTSEFCYKLSVSAAHVLVPESSKKPRVLIGRDTRNSGYMIESAFTAGMCENGVDVHLTGIVPTPAISYLVKNNFDIGIMISASHNPSQYNGIKFFDKNGFKFSDEIEKKIENILKNDELTSNRKYTSNFGKIFYKPKLKVKYKNFIIENANCTFDGMKIAIDAANGSASSFAKTIFESLGCKVYIINDKPNGVNINKNCGSTHIETISKYVTKINADVGLAFDGDADRVLFVDENGKLFDGDKIMAICAIDMKKKNILNKNTVATTIMSNLGFFRMGKKYGINVVCTDVGDKYIIQEMIKGGYDLGGEQSGHIIFLNCNTTGDGFITAVKLLSILKESSKKLSHFANVINIMPQVLVNANVNNKNKNGYLKDDEINMKIKDIEEKFKGNGRVLIRPSGTEPIVRIMIEGECQENITFHAKDLANLITKKLG